MSFYPSSSYSISPPTDMLDASDHGADYNNARRMSSSAVSAISSASATSDSAYSRIGEKRASSPGLHDDRGSARRNGDDDGSPRAGKRARPTLSLDSGAAGRYSPSNSHHSVQDGAHGSGSVPPTASSASDANGSSKVQLPSIFSQLDSPASSVSSIPHSHMHSQQQGQLQQQHQHQQHQLPHAMHGSIAGLPGSTVGGLLAAPRRLEQELRRGSLPNLYSDSLSAARQRLPSVNNGGSSLSLSFGPQGGYNSNNGSPSPNSLPGSALPRGAFTFSSPLPNVNGELAGYQFPGPSSSSDAANNSQTSSAPSSGYPQTPLESLAAQHQQQTGGEWITRPSSTPGGVGIASASASPHQGGPPLGGLLAGSPPRISGHSIERKGSAGGEEWFTPNGSFIVPGGSSSSSSSPHQQQQTAHIDAHHHTASALGVSPVAAAQAAAVAAQVAARPQRRRGKLPKPTTDFLKDWLHRHSDHPYPSEEEKKQLCNATGLSMSQVSNWMINVSSFFFFQRFFFKFFINFNYRFYRLGDVSLPQQNAPRRDRRRLCPSPLLAHPWGRAACIRTTNNTQVDTIPGSRHITCTVGAICTRPLALVPPHHHRWAWAVWAAWPSRTRITVEVGTPDTAKAARVDTGRAYSTCPARCSAARVCLAL